jgi:hypothetical protein
MGLRPFIVWVNYGTEGWSPSDDFETTDQVLDYISRETYGHPYVITKRVAVTLQEIIEEQ